MDIFKFIKSNKILNLGLGNISICYHSFAMNDSMSDIESYQNDEQHISNNMYEIVEKTNGKIKYNGNNINIVDHIENQYLINFFYPQYKIKNYNNINEDNREENEENKGNKDNNQNDSLDETQNKVAGNGNIYEEMIEEREFKKKYNINDDSMDCDLDYNLDYAISRMTGNNINNSEINNDKQKEQDDFEINILDQNGNPLPNNNKINNSNENNNN